MTEQEVLDLINAWIVANGNNEITADVLRPILVAMVEQPNDFIGVLSQLQTADQSNLVNAINEVYDMVGSVTDLGIQLHDGTDDPNVTPPAEYNIADFYIQKDGFNNPLQLWQYNGVSWVSAELTLTTTGITGASTFVNGTLNIPRYDLVIEDIIQPQDSLYRFDGYRKETVSHSSEGGFAKVGSSLFYIYRKGVNGLHISNTGDIYGKISTDNGKTWGTEYLIYSSVYDDRNLSVGNASNGDIVVIFRRYNSTTSADVDFGSITSADGVTWSAFGAINLGGGIIDNATFGNVFTRGSITHAVSYKSIGAITAHLLESNDNGVTWSVLSEIYNNPLSGTIVAEPKLIDLPDGTSIVLARSNNNDIIQFNSLDGESFTYKGVTNINKELDPILAEQPTPVELLVDGNNLIVVSAKRFGSANWSENNYNSGIKFYISNYEDIFANQEDYLLSFEIPRPIRNVFAPYGYASLYKIDDNNIAGFVTDNERMNESNLVASQLRTNESTYLFSFNLKKYDSKIDGFTDSSNYGGNEFRSKNEVAHYVINQNDIDGYEDLFVTGNDFIWKQVPDPNNASFGGIYRGGFLGSTAANATGNWPQVPTSGGTVIHAQSSDTSHAFEIGIGNTGLLPDSILARRRNSSGVWSTWGVLAREEKVVLLTGNQTIAGIKTFSSSPIVPTATTPTQAVPLGQVEGLIDNYVPLSGTEVGKPITGDLEFENGLGIKANTFGADAKLYFEDGGIIVELIDGSFTTSWNINNGGLLLSNDNPTSKGIVGNTFFDKDNDPSAFKQMGDSFLKYTTTEILALTPTAGDTYYNTTLNVVVYYDGTAWQKLSFTAM